MLLSVILPRTAMLPVLVCATTGVIIIPVLYSYRIYQKHKKEGTEYAAPPKSKAGKIAAAITAVIVSIIALGTAILMFTGNIEVQCSDTFIRISADYWTDLTVPYSRIDAVSYHEGLDTGIRAHGFGSARLSVGIFQNDEFGSYTLYAYTGAEEFAVMTSGDKTLVIGMKDANETKKIYDAVLKNIGK